MISMDKKYTTRDNREVRIYATNGCGAYPVHGVIEENGGWHLACWRVDGTTIENIQTCSDLIEVKSRMKFERWVVFERDGGYSLWVDKPNLALQTHLFALKHISFEVEEGEGLQHPEDKS
jgi:hypothetical protein